MASGLDREILHLSCLALFATSLQKSLALTAVRHGVRKRLQIIPTCLDLYCVALAHENGAAR